MAVSSMESGTLKPEESMQIQTGGHIKSLIANIRAALQHVRVTAEQFKTTDPWTVLMRYVSDRIAPSLGPFRPPDALPATG